LKRLCYFNCHTTCKYRKYRKYSVDGQGSDEDGDAEETMMEIDDSIMELEGDEEEEGEEEDDAYGWN
jgi:hypothetical protein